MTGFLGAALSAVRAAAEITGVRTTPAEPQPEPVTVKPSKLLPEPLLMRCPNGHDGARWVWAEPVNLADPTDYRRIDCAACGDAA